MNLTITTTTNAVKVNFNDSPLGDVVKGIWRKDKILSIHNHGTYIEVLTFEGSFQLSNAALAGCYVIDSVDGAAPSSLSDLFDKLSAMLG